MVMIIGYAYEAEEHCRNCARNRFAGTAPGEIDHNGVPVEAVDRENNTISPRFTSDEVLQDIHCGTCGDTIVEGPPADL